MDYRGAAAPKNKKIQLSPNKDWTFAFSTSSLGLFDRAKKLHWIKFSSATPLNPEVVQIDNKFPLQKYKTKF